MKNKSKKIIIRLFVSVMCLVLVFTLPKIGIYANGDIAQFYSIFVGEKSEYSGVIEIWNIDSFESGYFSKSSFLEKVAKDFQKRNKGTYVLVRNITEGECKYLLESGYKPSLISCSYGVVNGLKQYICSYSSDLNFEIFDNLSSAGRDKDGLLYGLAWCMGYYCLISTESKIGKTESDGTQSLNEIAYSSNYEYKVGKKSFESKSLVYGRSEYLMPKNAVFAYNKARSIQTMPQNFIALKSQYSAYSTFLSNGATILLGTQMDICRMENRVKQGKVSGVIYKPLMAWTDLIQFMFLIQNENELEKKYAEKFSEFLVSSSIQERVEKMGMFPVVAGLKSENKGVMLDIIHENNGDCEVFNVFENPIEFE